MGDHIKWLASHFGAGNNWDVKKDVNESQDPLLWEASDSIGNFMYESMANEEGFNTQEVLFGAGYAQSLDQGSISALSFAFTHFDDPWGQAEIAAGVKWN